MANYHAAIRMDAEFTPAHVGLGHALFQARRYAAAAEAMERALALEPELADASSLHVLIGRSWQELGDWLAALQWYERAMRIDPLDPKALDHLAMALRPRAAHRGGVGAVSNAKRDQPRQPADSRQRGRRALSPGPPPGGDAEP